MAFLAAIFSFSGTSGQRAALIAWLAALAAQVGLQVLSELTPNNVRFFFPILGLAIVGLAATMARRLHHAGYSGRWAIASVVPLLGLIAGLLIVLLPERRARLWANNGARIVGYLAIAVFLGLCLWRVWWTPFWIASESMKPALLIGDYVVARAAVGADVQRGDVVMLRHPLDGQVVVKRVIALGGDLVALRGGKLWLNGAELVQLPQGEFSEIMAPQGPDQLRPRCENGLVGEGMECRKSRLREALPDGRSYDVLNIDAAGAGDEFAEIAVPAGQMFLLGDNRDNSLDSRFDVGVGGLGLVAQDRVLAVARRVLFSSQGRYIVDFWNWRLGRIMREVQ